MPKLNITNHIKAGANSGVNYYSRLASLDDINIDPDISGVFKIDERVLGEIVDSIREGGFDKAQPLVLWKGKGVIVDGHTRYAAAVRLGLESVPVVEKEFDTLQDAMLYTFERQAVRRNLTSAELISASQLLVERKERDGGGRAAEIIAKKLGVSTALIYRAHKVSLEASLDDLKKIQKGETSINAVYKKIKQPADEHKSEAEEKTAEDGGLKKTPVKKRAFLEAAVMNLEAFARDIAGKIPEEDYERFLDIIDSITKDFQLSIPKSYLPEP
jgi:ParB family chromosome partitioning protein